MTTPTDPLAVGQAMVAVLDDGRRTGTYKLAVAIALLDLAVERAPCGPDAAVTIDLDVLAARVMDQYWGQLRPFEGKELRQSRDGRSVVLRAVGELRAAVGGPRGREVPLETAQLRVPELYEDCLAKVKLFVVQYPLALLQNAGSSMVHECFLYDDSWLGTASKRAVVEHGNRVELFPGVCQSLARLAPLLKPAFQPAWVKEVRAMNAFLADEPDIEHHLFGSNRVSLARPGEQLAEAFGAECFYCASRLGRRRQVDHVLPWARVGLDGVSNLVLACARCNSSKADLLPDPSLVGRALGRGRDRLAELAGRINWPHQYDRVESAARGLYATQTGSTPIWLGVKRVEPLARIDLVWPARAE